MSLLPGVFKPSDVKDEELLENGFYVMEVFQSSMKDTKAGDGKYLSISVKVMQSENKDDVGRVVFENFNLVNPNEQAVQIAQRQFKGLCEAVGLEEVEESEQLHNKLFCAKIGISAGNDDYPDSNCIKKYMPESAYKESLEGDDYLDN